MSVELSKDEFQYLESFIVDYPVIEKQFGIETVYVLNIPEDDALEIRERIADDIASYFDENYEPTKTAMIIESLIDKLFGDSSED